MSEQSSRETSRVTQEEGENTSQQQIFSQSPQQLRIHFSYDQNVPSFSELLIREYGISDSSRRIIENMSADELQEMFMPSSSSASAIQQPYLRMTLRHALQRIQAAQQRYLDRNQFVIQLPMQANQQSTELIQQANAQQQLPQMPSQQLQSMFHVLTPSSTSNSTNAQMFRQFPQSQANSNLTPQQSQQQQQPIHFSYDQNVPSFSELLIREYGISDSSRRIIENMSADELQEMFMPSSSSASAIQQPYLRMTLRHALQRIQAAQQRYLDRNQFVIQLPMQANQQSTELIQQANAQQQLPQMPSQQLQSMFHVLTPSSTSNTIKFPK
ncbi:unnamed protein product [Brugia pahangi]|uniref:CUE domain-containing protein n=1 Tax=Brugia pahangi TaxID=6280 RepID=A0A0N4T700_BRUPA|nr:unnamed protein product [Brugia pahangi]